MKKILLIGLIFISNYAQSNLNPNEQDKCDFMHFSFQEAQKYNELLDALEDNNLSKANALFTKMVRNKFPFSALSKENKKRLQILAKETLQQSTQKFEDRRERVTYMFKLWLISGLFGCVFGSISMANLFITPMGVITGLWALGGFSVSGISFGLGTLRLFPYHRAKREKNKAQQFVKLLNRAIENR